MKSISRISQKITVVESEHRTAPAADGGPSMDIDFPYGRNVIVKRFYEVRIGHWSRPIGQVDIYWHDEFETYLNHFQIR